MAKRRKKRRLRLWVRIALPVLALALIFALSGCFRSEEETPEELPASAPAPQGYTAERLADAHEAALAMASAEATVLSEEEANSRGNLVLVNKQFNLEKGYEPPNLADIKYYASDRSAASRFMVKEAADAFHQLSEAAKSEADYTIVITTAYRSYSVQKGLWDNYVAQDGEAAASRYSARPGTSEHQSGWATDVSSPSIGYKLSRDYANTEEGAWLKENAHRFGFIIRYPEEGEPITGYMYEPWHIRYVGVEAAAVIREYNITLEEYLLLEHQIPGM